MIFLYSADVVTFHIGWQTTILVKGKVLTAIHFKQNKTKQNKAKTTTTSSSTVCKLVHRVSKAHARFVPTDFFVFSFQKK